MQGGLIYVGDGGFIPEVPARDLTEAEVAQYGKAKLLQSGLYKEPGPSNLGGRQNKLVPPHEEK
jgi:hypothetical protein